jgi:hypothetical protein
MERENKCPKERWVIPKYLPLVDVSIASPKNYLGLWWYHCKTMAMMYLPDPSIWSFSAFFRGLTPTPSNALKVMCSG